MVGNNLLSEPSVSGIVVTWRDVTARKVLEQQLHDLRSVVARDGAQRRWMRDLPPLAPSEGTEPEAPNSDPDSWSAT